MILTILVIGLFFAMLFMGLGYREESFPLVYLSMFVFLLLGLTLLSEGISVESGARITDTGGLSDINATVITTYTVYTPTNSSIVSILGNFFFYGSVVGFLLSTFVALRGSQ